MYEFEFTNNSVKAVNSAAAGFGALAGAYRKYGKVVLHQVKNKVIKPGIARNFANGRFGNPIRSFVPIAAYTKKWRESKGGDANLPPLTSGISRGGQALNKMAIADVRFRIQHDRMTYGNWPSSKKSLVRLLHDGGTNSKGLKVPGRPFTELDPQALRELEKLFVKEVETITRNLHTRQGLKLAKTHGFVPVTGPLF